MTATLIETTAPPISEPESDLAPKRRPYVPWVVLGVSLCSFGYGESTIPAATPSQWGLLAVASPAYGASILLVTIGFVLAIRRQSFSASVAATLMMIVVQRLPRAMATDLPMYGWTYKHLAVVDYIQHSHSLAREVDIYNCWSGLFGWTAWFSDLTRVSEIDIAHWWTPIFHLFLAAMVYGVARAWGLTSLPAITATFITAALNWVEQDYYSPQSVAIFLAAAIFALVGLSAQRAVGTLLILVLFGAMTITHQLTPYWVLLAIGILVASRKMRPWWIVVPMAVMLFAFLAINWDQVSHFTLFSSNPIKNTQTNIAVKGVLGQQITSAGVRALSASMWVTVGLALLYRWRKRQPFWTLGVFALSPMLILGGQNYGGEAIFRVFLYSLIGCSLVLAPLLMSTITQGTTRLLGGSAVALIATALAAQGNTGGWYANVVPKDQYDISRAIVGQAELPAYITSVAPVWPERVSWRYIDYARFDRNYDVPMVTAKMLAHRHFDNDADYAEFIKALYMRPQASTYLIFSEQMHVYSWYFGILPWDAFPNLKQRILRDTDNWRPIFDGGGVAVFVHQVVVDVK